MRTSSSLRLLASLSFFVELSFSLVTPERRQQLGGAGVPSPYCSRLGPYYPSCWDSLDVGGYAKKWWAANQHICEEQERSFVSCFMDRALNSSGIIGYCDIIGEIYGGSEGQGICSLFFADTRGKLQMKNLDPFSKTAEDAYILYHVAASWRWFQSITDALEATKFANGIEPLLRLFTNNPNPQLRLDYYSLYNSMTAGVLDLRLPSGTASLSSLLKGSPSNIDLFASRYTPNPEDNGTFIFDGTPGSVEKLASGYVFNVLGNVLWNITGNQTLFNDFSAGGAFIGDVNSQLAKTDTLLQKFYTWLTSYIINLKHINISVARDTDPLAFHKFGHDSAARVDCDYYEPEGICSAWWHDSSTNTTYGLDSIAAGTSAHNYYDLMKSLFANYTTGQLLFAGADACNSTGWKDGIKLNYTTGTVDCIASSNLFSFDETCADVGCEFSAGSTGSQPDWSAHKCFPPSYLGLLRSERGDFQPCTDKLLGTNGS
ncbi:MAG: hypothetical protein M1812_004653 [Candelaria pacifica]|nr:MAG: hypothetical protein M1812_004653 [Candelaria pacifica]